jgi:hypothetical protein
MRMARVEQELRVFVSLHNRVLTYHESSIQIISAFDKKK